MIAALAVLLLSPAATAPPLPGLYLANQMEVGAGLELQANGRFRYALDYGAVSEGAEGRWTADATTVRLTSDTAPNDGERSPAVFRNEVLERQGDLLLLPRYETVIRFRRVEPQGE